MLGHPVRACLRPASEGIEGEGPGLCRGTAEGKVDGGGAGCWTEERGGGCICAVTKNILVRDP